MNFEKLINIFLVIGLFCGMSNDAHAEEPAKLCIPKMVRVIYDDFALYWANVY